MCKTAISEYPKSMRSEIMNVLLQKGNVIEKYHLISRILENYNSEIWLLFDEFQIIVKKWVGDANELAELCSYIHYIQDSGNIKIVFCGSDELVRIFECVHDDNWSEFKIKTEETWVFIGQLSEIDFAAMMNDRSIWETLPNGMPWNLSTDSDKNISPVLHSLYWYTGGNAICGKIFGEELLQKVKQNDFSCRSYFYPSDITKIAYELLNADASKLKSLLIAHTTKNLENELPYLIYIASELSKDINKSDVSLKSILDFFSHKESEEIETAIKVLIARGIIKTTAKSNRFAFTTLFYYDFFKVLAAESVIQKLNESEKSDTDPTDTRTWQEQVIEILKNQPSVKRGDFVNIIDSLEDESLSKGIGDLLGKGQTVNMGVNNGPVSGSQTIIHINVKNITNTLNNILTANGDPKKIISGLSDLPRLDSYLPALNPKETGISDARLSYAIDGYTSDMEESLQAAVEETETELPAVWDILKISEEDFNVFHQKYNIPACFLDSLRLAAQLEEMFTNGSIGSELSTIDYSPVSIMYCKLIESMLKEYHTDTYSRALSGIETDLRKDARHKYTWGAIRKLPQQQKQKLTIGSFAFPINVSRNNSPSDTTSNISDLANESFGSAADWRSHAAFIADIRDIRNPSAHGNIGHQITLAQLQQLTKELFDDKGLMRLIELVKKPIV